jgi:hypothetical protein
MSLDDLSNETRLIATPWSRMVRGIGLGQHPIAYDPVAASRIRASYELLAARVPGDAYTAFGRRTAELALRAARSGGVLPAGEAAAGIDAAVAEIRAVKNPYYRVTAGSILLDAVAKLGLDPAPLLREDFAAEVLATVDEIEPDRIADENRGRHGDYERLSAFTAVFLAYGQLGLQDRLVSGERNYVREALSLLDTVPAPFFRGRGGSMLISVVAVLGFGDLITEGGRDRVRETLDYLHRADEIALPPAFPKPMSPAFGKIYPLVTMLNAVAVMGRRDCLGDRLDQMRRLWAQITPVERTHMGLYYLVALHNLGRLDEIGDVGAFVRSVSGQWPQIDPGASYFLDGISYPYMIETALLSGHREIITADTAARLAGCFRDLDHTDEDRANRPYPFSYAITSLGELGASDALFTPLARYDGQTAMEWVISRVPTDAAEERNRLAMLNHALINWALRLRGTELREPPLTRGFRFPSAH